MSSDIKNNITSFGKLALIFSAVMLLVLAITALQTHLKVSEVFNKHNILETSKETDLLISNTDDKVYAYKLFNLLVETAQRHGIDSKELEEAINRSSENYRTKIKAFFYKNNVLIKSFNCDLEDLKLFETFLIKLNLKGKEFDLAQRELQKQLALFFGPGHRLELIKLVKGIVKTFASEKSNQFTYWNSYSDGLGVFFATHEFPDFVNRFESLNKKNRQFGAGSPNTKTHIPPIGFTQDQMEAARIKCKMSGTSFTDMNDFYWFFTHKDNGDYICRAVPVKTFFQNAPKWPKLIYNISALLLLLTIIFYITAHLKVMPGSTICKKLDSSSIKFRIIALFSMASIFPVIFTYLIGSTSMEGRREVIENGILNESIAAISKLDEIYETSLENTKAFAIDLREYIANNSLTEEVLQEKLNKYSLPRSLVRIEIRDGDLNTLFTTDDREVVGAAEASDLFGRVALKEHAPQRMGIKANIISPADLLTESVLSTDEIGMATMIRQRNRQWVFKMGTFPTTWYWDVYPELATGTAFMSVANQMVTVYGSALRNYCKKKIDPAGTMLFATKMSYEQSTFKLLPENNEFDNYEIIKYAVLSYLTNRVVFKTIELNNIKYWLTAKTDKNIGAYVFMHLISQEERLKSLEPLKWQLITGCLFALIISLVGASFITRLIIRPVEDLSSGIKAIRERNKDFRIPIRRQDELGALAKAFNKVINELQELEYGKYVQESLLPKAPLSVEGYDMAFFTISATDLAGDYHDTVMLKDGKLVLILGDVTGHGISASLAMAMAKATVNYAVEKDINFPEDALDTLNTLFNRELKPRHKFMTFIILVLNPDTGELIFDNMGQCYPIYYTQETKTKEEIAIPSMPLGAMKKRKKKLITKHMQAGDAVILYSDGIIECSDKAGEMFGYDRFEELFRHLMEQDYSAQEAINEIMHQLNTFRVEGMYPDDVTLVVLKKKR